MSDPDLILTPIVVEPDQRVRIEAEEGERPAGVLRTLVRLSLGGTLLAMEALSHGLNQLDQEPAQPPPVERDLESVLIPAEEWDTTLRRDLKPSLRQTLLGFTLDTQSRLGRAAGAILRRGNCVVGTMDRALDPVLSSRALSPVRGPFEGLVERGQAQVDRWRELGRAEEARSRALAQAALDRAVDASINAVSGNPRVQILVQEFMYEQSMGLAGEAIEEVRERTVTGDMLLERPVRSILRRRPRESLPVATELIKNLPKPSAKG